VDRSAADDDAGFRNTSDASVAVADAPSTSGAHWANRDNENIYRRTGTPFRRPNAQNSFTGEDDESEQDDQDPTSWWGTPGSGDDDAHQENGPGSERAAQERSWPQSRSQGQERSWPQADETDQEWSDAALPDRSRPEEPESQRQFAPTPEFGPAPPANGSRISFGVTDGPIGGYRPGYGPSAAPTSPAGRTGYAPGDAPTSPAGRNGYAPGAAPTSPAGRNGYAPSAAPTSPAARPVSPASRSKPLVPPVTGHTGEIFNGPAREIRAHRAVKQNTGGHAALKAPTPPRGTPTAAPAAAPKKSRVVTVAALALGAVVLLAGAVGGVVYFSGDSQGLGSVLSLNAGKTEGRTATAPLDGRTTASFEMVAASNQVTVKTQDLGENLYKITTADDSGMVPSPAVSADRVQLHLTPKGEGTSGDVTIILSTKVRWALRFSGGSDEQVIDMTGGKVSGVSLVGGARRVELTLPKPSGTVPVQVTGALEELSVSSPADAPVRVKVEAGAKTVAAGTRTLRDVVPGSTLTPKDWQVKDRYDVAAKSWVTLLSVDATS